MSLVKVPTWAEPDTMASTYALLYNVHVVCGAPYLPTLMEERVWRLVYGNAAVRRRDLCWAYASGDADSEVESAAFVYKKQRSTPEERVRMRALRALIGELRSTGADLEARALQYRIARAQRELAQLETGGDTEFFLRPARTIERQFAGGQRAFEAQVHDGYLCALHAFNNVANSVVLSPPDLLQSIELLRSLTTRFASLEEVMLAALREGVFLLPLKVSAAAELGALDRDQAFPRRKYALELIERAGGMIIAQKRPEPNPGHFVALVHDSTAAAAANGEENDHEWVVYSYDRIVAHGPTAADAIDEFVFGVLAEACEDDDVVERAYALPTREERRRALERGCGGGDSQATFFVGLLPVCLEALCEDSQQAVRFEDLDGDAVAWRYMLRSIVRRSLSEMSVISYGDADECDLKVAEPVSPATLDAIWMLFSDSACARVPEPLRFDGMDGVNAASVIAVRVSVDEQLNAIGEQLARAVLMADADAARAILVQTRSLLRELPALGLLFTMRDNFRKFCSLVDNTHWFRLLALSLSTTSILSALADNSSGSWRNLTVLFVRLAHSDLRTLGVNMSSTPATSKLYDRSLDTYELALELLRQCGAVGGGGGRAPLPSLELFERCEDDDGDASSEATFVALLRQTLFSMPFENNSFGIIERIAPEQPHNAPTHAAIAAHFASTARHFVGAVHRREMALALVDTLAFDPRFAGTPEELDDATREPTETHRLDDDWRPRFVERMVQVGIPTVHRCTFGALITQPDERAPILTNIERLPLPARPGRWLSTRPLATPDVYLATAPLIHLPDLREAGRESLRRSKAVKRRREAVLDRQD